MAYLRFYRISVAALCSVALGILHAFYKVFDWPNYAPDIRESLHIDRMVRASSAEPQGMRRSLSFHLRALLHDLFTGSGFTEPQATGSA